MTIPGHDAPSPAALQLGARPGHSHDRLGGVAALVALASPGPGERLLQVLTGKHAEGARHAGSQATSWMPLAALGAT